MAFRRCLDLEKPGSGILSAKHGCAEVIERYQIADT
jgi:hypothetical protein